MAINIAMIIDCFTFYNELDMLECRLEYLHDKVDKFVLVESTITHSGKSKPMFFQENKDRYKKFLDKIIYVSIDIDPKNYDWNHSLSKNFNNASWQVENLQRNGILNGIKDLPNDSIIMISDLDEIPNIDAIDRAVRLLDTKLFVSLETRQFYYNLGQCLVEPWPATVVSTAEVVKSYTPQRLREIRNSLLTVKKGGWHLTYFANAESIRNKIMNFAHQEFNNEKFTDISYIEQKLKNGEELYGRPFPMIKVSKDSFPPTFKKCFDRYFSKDVISHYADRVEGFFNIVDFEYYKKIVANAVDGDHFVEVGSYKGRSSSFMAVEIANSGKKIIFDCVDTWEGSEEHQAGKLFEDVDVVNHKLYDVFLKNMEPVTGFYNAKRLTSIKAASTYLDNSISMVFIDAAHDYDSVYADILAWAPKVKSGGIISGHDYPHPPVRRAVEELLGEVSTIGDCWYVFKA